MSDSTSQPYTAPYFIKYNPTLVAEFGSQTAVLLFDRLEYWFSKKQNEFYKFIEPCEHPLCKKGDTWTEELGLSKRIFRTAFDKIGIRYISKTAFEKEADPFKGKLFAYYRDRQTKKTIFVRNNLLLKKLYKRLKHILQEHQSIQIQETDEKKKSDDALKTAQELEKIWVNEIGNKGLVPLTVGVSERMSKAFADNFQGSLECWKAYCLKIASSKFLMGEKQGTHFKIKILVALTEKFKTQVEGGIYELSTREPSKSKESDHEPAKETSDDQSQETGSSTTSGSVPSYAGAVKEQIDTSSFIYTTETNQGNELIFKEDDLSEVLAQTYQIASDMKAVWVEEIGSRGLVNLTPEMSQRLKRALEEVFQGSLANWQAHCRKIASSQFLMGEKQGTNYEIRLPVAITQKFQIQLEEGRFELKTRETNADKKKKAEYEKLRAKSVQRERIQKAIYDLEREKEDHEKALIIDHKDALSSDEIEKYKQTFEDLMKGSDCSKGNWFREKGWDDWIVKLDFDMFLWNKLKETLTKEDLERPDLDEKIEEFKQDMLIFSTKKAGGEKC